MNISPIASIIIGALAVAVIFGLIVYMKRERTTKLRSKFGPEYDKAIDAHGNRAHAESELQRRADRVSKFDIHPLSGEECSRFADEWKREQSLFVDDPRAAVQHAHALVQDVMKRRGYPVGDFEQNAADLSVDHPVVVENYRQAHEIALRDERGRAETEDLRKAMIFYHTLFEDLLDQPIQASRRETFTTPEEIRR